jgi:DNA invertase Pin-like site-specific DNA recombinase
MKVAIYVRVSTKQQSVDMQLVDLQAVADKSGWDIVKIYRDDGVSGSVPSEQRPGLKALMGDVVRKKFDMVVIWSIDRLARSTLDLMKTMQLLQEKKVDLYAYKQAIDTSTPSGRMMWQLLGVFAEFEREMIRERVTAGLNEARAKGVRLGRPPIDKVVEEKILQLRAEGMGMLKIGRTLKVGTSQVQRICATMN